MSFVSFQFLTSLTGSWFNVKEYLLSQMKYSNPCTEAVWLTANTVIFNLLSFVHKAGVEFGQRDSNKTPVEVIKLNTH